MFHSAAAAETAFGWWFLSCEPAAYFGPLELTTVDSAAYESVRWCGAPAKTRRRCAPVGPGSVGYADLSGGLEVGRRWFALIRTQRYSRH